ncbi:MAG: three-Cys-motif partner protein TcmP [Rhizobium sp.]|nr:three-Cys-motif partner protein TcmP [Rhizobium sp.]
MTKRDSDRYEIDPSDGLRREIVGGWSVDKHKRLKRYVDITRATRRKFDKSGSTYIDLYCGTGRLRIKSTGEVSDGSPLVAYRQSESDSPFSQIHIADVDSENLAACASRLEMAGAESVIAQSGPANETVSRICRRLHPSGLHLAFLDPYSIGALPFSVLQELGELRRMDLIVHVSEMDLQRNIIAMAQDGVLDRFAPGWERAVDLNQRNDVAKRQLLEYWRSLLSAMGYLVSDNIERVTGQKNQPLYWLVLASKNSLADKFWGQVSNVEPQMRLTF